MSTRLLQRLSRNRAFTLVELLVVILIIGILIAVAAPSFLGQVQKADVSAIEQQASTAYNAAKDATIVAGNTGETFSTGTTLKDQITSSEPSLGSVVTAGTGYPSSAGTANVGDTTGTGFDYKAVTASGTDVDCSAANTGIGGFACATTQPTGGGGSPPIDYSTMNISTFAGDGGGTTGGFSFGCFCTLPDSRYSGDAGAATAAELDSPQGVAADLSGDIFIADSSNNVIREVPAHTGTQFGQSMTAGDIYTIAGNYVAGAGYSGDGGPATSAKLSPGAVAVDSSGDVYIADGSNRIREVAAHTGTQFGQSMTVDDIYTIAGNGTAGYTGDGGVATSAELNGPAGVAVSTTGNVYIADEGNRRVREVAVGTGDISTFAGDANPIGSEPSTGDGGPAVAATFGGVLDIAVDTHGNVYITDGNQCVREVSGGIINTLAGNCTGAPTGFAGDGGPAVDATFDYPRGLAVDSAGNIFIVDEDNQRVRMVSAATGDISTIAGSGSGSYFGDYYAGPTGGFSGDGGPATSAQMYAPLGVAVDSTGNVYIADRANYRIRELTPS
jgi:prepilin-type N-terminal cleavage/methylation domain-containing protein